jgi:hypothetical protein
MQGFPKSFPTMHVLKLSTTPLGSLHTALCFDRPPCVFSCLRTIVLLDHPALRAFAPSPQQLLKTRSTMQYRGTDSPGFEFRHTSVRETCRAILNESLITHMATCRNHAMHLTTAPHGFADSITMMFSVLSAAHECPDSGRTTRTAALHTRQTHTCMHAYTVRSGGAFTRDYSCQRLSCRCSE